MSKRPSSMPPEPPSSKRAHLNPSFLKTIDDMVHPIAERDTASGLTNDMLVLTLSMILPSFPPEAHMRTFKSNVECKQLLEDNPETAETLRSIICQRRYQDVMSLSILREEGPSSLDHPLGKIFVSALVTCIKSFTTGGDRHFDDNLDASFNAFQIPYVPGFPNALLKALDTYNGHSSYNQVISIIQSSGTGKSRGVEEAAQSRFTFLFNLRRDIEGYTYPHPDVNVRDYFIRFGTLDDIQIQRRYAAFLCSLFTRTGSLLSESNRHGVPLPQWWYACLNKNAMQTQLDPERVSFYEGVVTDAKRFMTENVFKTLRTSCDEFIKRLITQYELDNLLQNPRSRVTCILAFDEAQELTEEPKNKQSRTLFHNLALVLKQIASYHVFSVFLSTNSNLRLLSPPLYLHPSLRDLRDLPNVYPPITELPFDVFARDLYNDLRKSGKSALTATCSVEVMARFGRPLWHSLQTRGYTSIINLARTKLVPKVNFTQDYGAQLACLGIRIGLDFDASRQTGRQMESELVASYMRIAFAIPEHRDFMRSGTPSEPILAEAAAQLLNMSSFEELAPRVLCSAFENGFLARGERGEMVGRLLWTFAHDKVLRDHPRDVVVKFHQPISVIDFLKALFHENHWDIILRAKPVGNKDGPPLSQAFKDAYIHFSHFVDAVDYNVIELQQVYRLLLRGAALNCQRNQRLIDFLTPILFGPPDSTGISSSMSSVLQAQVLNSDHPENISLCPTLVNSINNHPILSLVHHLGSPKETVECDKEYVYSTHSRPGRDPSARHYQIVANGCSSDTYRVIPKVANKAYAMLLGSNLMDDFARRDIAECADMLNQLNPCHELGHGDNNCRWFGKDSM